VNTLMPALIGFGSALLAIVLTPFLQHYFWQQQRRDEIRLNIANRIAELTGSFTEHLYEWKQLPPHTRDPEKSKIFWRWQGLAVEVQVLFSKSTYEQFLPLDRIISVQSSVTHDEAPLDIEAFAAARKAAMNAVFAEIGVRAEQDTATQERLA
jgi:hypothetical protein